MFKPKYSKLNPIMYCNDIMISNYQLYIIKLYVLFHKCFHFPYAAHFMMQLEFRRGLQAEKSFY